MKKPNKRYIPNVSRLHAYIPYAVLLGLLFSLNIGYAQLKLVPLERHAGTPLPVKNKSLARTQEGSLLLPFRDDFSSTPVNDPSNAFSGFPLTTLWEKSGGTWVNSGNGINAPSIHVATLDGLDSAGLPYSEDILTNGFGDHLTSQPIDLGEVQVPAGERASVYLSFYYQWKGQGEAPDPKDYLRVEFKTNTGVWETVMTINTKPDFSADVFYDTILQVSEDRFFFDAFQFRIRNFGRQSGPYDSWNIDYVYLNKGRHADDIYSPDAALASTLSPLFGKYTAIPFTHFQENPVITPVTFDLFNLRYAVDDPQGRSAYGYRAAADFTHYSNAEPTLYQDSLVTKDDVSAVVTMLPLERRQITLDKIPDPGNAQQFDPVADSVLVDLTIRLGSGDTPEFRYNDTLSATYRLTDHYAYDDGTAEYAALLLNPGDRLAYLFEMLSSAPDTLVGFDIYIPKYGVESNLTTTFFILGEENGRPGNTIYTSPNRTVSRTGTNQFQRIAIEPVLVPPKFYIGWEAPVGGELRVGIDLNNDASANILVDTKGTWEQNMLFEGSLMIRPRFGKGDPITSIPEEHSPIVVYPNPSTGSFFLSGEIDALEIISTTGQQVPFQWANEINRTRISLDNARAGMYILKFKHGDFIITQKIVIY